MNKKILLISCILLTLGLCTFIFYDIDNNKVVIENGDSKQIINTNALTMMYETDYQSGEYQVSNETVWPQDGYTFNETLSKCENESVLTWDNENRRVVVSTSVSDKCYVYFDKDPDTLANYIVNDVYTGVDGENGLYYHDGQGNYINADQEAGDNSYRYAGANPNNYVCFGSDEATCSEDNLYRIIGAFDEEKSGNYQIKLIKSDYANSNLLGTDGDYSAYTYSSKWGNSSYYKGSLELSDLYLYYWFKLFSLTWYGSFLNITNLNKNYIDCLGNVWTNKIATKLWQSSKNTTSNIYGVSVKQTYQNEIVNSDSDDISNVKIGLMYVSDYGYAASPENWSINLKDYNNDNNRNNNWMFMGLREWTISTFDFGGDAFIINDSGEVSSYNVSNFEDGFYGSAVRPTFYLESSVTYVSGSGDMIDPIRIN